MQVRMYASANVWQHHARLVFYGLASESLTIRPTARAAGSPAAALSTILLITFTSICKLLSRLVSFQAYQMTTTASSEQSCAIPDSLRGYKT